jgi:hypothetical protein
MPTIQHFVTAKEIGYNFSKPGAATSRHGFGAKTLTLNTVVKSRPEEALQVLH